MLETVKKYFRTGWVEVADTWTYASATTITVPSGAASKYQKGDKIKLTQTTVKYFYIVGVADTVLTVTGGSDYSLANATITSPYFSKIENPQGFPGNFNYTATITPAESMTVTDSGSTMYFSIVGNRVLFSYSGSGTTGGTASTYIDVTLPVGSLSAAGYWSTCMIRDGTYQGGLLLVGTTTLRFYKEGLAAWTLGTSRQWRCGGSYVF